MDECREIQHWIEFGHDAGPETVSRDQLKRHLEFLASTLPAKAVDVETGRDRVAVYFRLLSGYSEAAIAYMSQRVCAELNWFPTPHQCLEILRDYQAPQPAKEIARHNVQWFLQEQMEAFFAALAAGPVDQADIDDKPDQWKRIAEGKWLLRRERDGYTQRFEAIPLVQSEAA